MWIPAFAGMTASSAANNTIRRGGHRLHSKIPFQSTKSKASAIETEAFCAIILAFQDLFLDGLRLMTFGQIGEAHEVFFDLRHLFHHHIVAASVNQLFEALGITNKLLGRRG